MRIFAFAALFFSINISGFCQDIFSILDKAGIKLKARISRHDYDRFSYLTHEEEQVVTAGKTSFEFKDSQWNVSINSLSGKGRLPGTSVKVVFLLL